LEKKTINLNEDNDEIFNEVHELTDESRITKEGYEEDEEKLKSDNNHSSEENSFYIEVKSRNKRSIYNFENIEMETENEALEYVYEISMKIYMVNM
jgi:hypothetical protein